MGFCLLQSGWFVSKHLSAYLAPISSSVYTDIIGGMLTVSKFVSTRNTTLYQERLIIVLGTHSVPGLTGLYLHRYLLSLLIVFTELFSYNSSYESSYARLIKFSKDSLGLRLFLCCGAGGLEVSISTLTDTMSVMNTLWTLVFVFQCLSFVPGSVFSWAAPSRRPRERGRYSGTPAHTDTNVTTRASNEPSRRFHNHGEGPYACTEKLRYHSPSQTR